LENLPRRHDGIRSQGTADLGRRPNHGNHGERVAGRAGTGRKADAPPAAHRSARYQSQRPVDRPVVCGPAETADRRLRQALRRLHVDLPSGVTIGERDRPHRAHSSTRGRHRAGVGTARAELLADLRRRREPGWRRQAQLHRLPGLPRRLRPLASNERTATMSVEDRLAIQEAIARYSHTYDSKDADAFAQLFVEDGILEVIVPGESSPTVRLSSRAAIREWAAQRHRLN